MGCILHEANPRNPAPYHATRQYDILPTYSPQEAAAPRRAQRTPRNGWPGSFGALERVCSLPVGSQNHRGTRTVHVSWGWGASPWTS